LGAGVPRTADTVQPISPSNAARKTKPSAAQGYDGSWSGDRGPASGGRASYGTSVPTSSPDRGAIDSPFSGAGVYERRPGYVKDIRTDIFRWVSERACREYATRAARIATPPPLRGLAAGFRWSCLPCGVCLVALGMVRIRSRNIHIIVEVACHNYLTQLMTRELGASALRTRTVIGDVP